MKKLFIYFSIAIFSLIAISCSKDDDKIDETSLKELFVKLNKKTIVPGEKVVFKAVDIHNKEVLGVDFYVNDAKATNDYDFNKEGVYSIVAKKQGYKASYPENLMVGNVIDLKLKLVANKSEIIAGEEVSFTVTSGGKVVTGFYIEQIGSGLLLSEKWTAHKASTYSLYAFKGGYVKSEVITIKVNPKEIKDDKSFVINGTKYGVEKVLLVADAKDEGSDKPIPYLYTDITNGKKYQVFRLYAINYQSQAIGIYTMGVYVSNEKDFVLPSNANPADVFPLGGIGVVGDKEVIKFGKEGIDRAFSNWLAPFDAVNERPGKIKYELVSKDKKLEVKYEGDFYELSFFPIKSNVKNISSNKKQEYLGFSELQRIDFK
ncbi:hypothetical protein LNQ81_03435 [Myroides sp. M-43]|uniref:hypothetical protein n=1 Tax=Myroides oncorhynchi TaxID=2893756 RepID=UPI001E32A829|nr:hypothetical protein [Myroides oncorhynchi]MCC9041754.1 hypothetical protein [Myroides oncorhynchi]